MAVAVAVAVAEALRLPPPVSLAAHAGGWAPQQQQPRLGSHQKGDVSGAGASGAGGKGQTALSAAAAASAGGAGGGRWGHGGGGGGGNDGGGELGVKRDGGRAMFGHHVAVRLAVGIQYKAYKSTGHGWP